MARTLQYGAIVALEDKGELKSFTEDNVFLAEPDLFKILDVKIKSGDPATDFKRPFTVMLSQKSALRYWRKTRAQQQSRICLAFL